MLVGRHAGVVLHKRIPAGAGLGGGSADAAAVLRWAGFEDLDAAASLGADVAFCLVGGRARVTGIGEVVEPLEFEDLTVTLVTPPLHCSTPQIYRAGTTWGARGVTMATTWNPRPCTWSRSWRVGVTSWPTASGQRPRLAGSGSTWWVFGEHPGEGRVVARTVPRGR